MIKKNIIINNFGNEDKSYITSLELKNALKSHFRGISKIFKLIYCNQDFKSNNTIRYIQNDSKNLEIFEDGKFIVMNKEYILDSIILDIWTMLNNYYIKLEDEGKLSNFKDTLICNETWDRIIEFIRDFNKLKNGDSINIESIRQEILNILKIYPTEKQKKRRRKSTKF